MRVLADSQATPKQLNPNVVMGRLNPMLFWEVEKTHAKSGESNSQISKTTSVVKETKQNTDAKGVDDCKQGYADDDEQKEGDGHADDNDRNGQLRLA